MLGTSLKLSTSFHPQTDGQTERYNGMLEEYLRHFVTASQKNWAKLLDVAQFCFNCQKSSATNKSPFEIVMGQQPLLPHTLDGPYEGRSPKAHKFTKDWKMNMDIAKSYLEQASERMKKWADLKRRPLEFNVGDKVLVKLNPAQIRASRYKKDKRLVRKFEGPVEILARVGSSAYHLGLPSWLQIHPVMHVSNLRPFHGDEEDPSRQEVARPAIKVYSTTREVECILDIRKICTNHTLQVEYLVKWKNLDDEENTWEKAKDISAFRDHLSEYHERQRDEALNEAGRALARKPKRRR